MKITRFELIETPEDPNISKIVDMTYTESSFWKKTEYLNLKVAKLWRPVLVDFGSHGHEDIGQHIYTYSWFHVYDGQWVESQFVKEIENKIKEINEEKSEEQRKNWYLNAINKHNDPKIYVNNEALKKYIK